MLSCYKQIDQASGVRSGEVFRGQAATYFAFNSGLSIASFFTSAIICSTLSLLIVRIRFQQPLPIGKGACRVRLSAAT